MFYYEERNVFGKWTGRTIIERPTGNTASGTKREIRNVQEVPPHMEQLTLGALQRHFNPEPVAEVVRITQRNPWPDYEAAPIQNDADGHLIELAMDLGAEMINNDGTVYAIMEEDLLRLLKRVSDPIHVITKLADEIHADNVRAGWWTDLKTGEDLHGKRNVGELLCLIHSEVSEAMEGHRKRLMDDKLPHRPMLRAELIDAMIRILDLLGSQDNAEHPAGVIFQEKREYNAQRADHKPAARLASGGKAF